jgi:SAM-dependent methyltransferase
MGDINQQTYLKRHVPTKTGPVLEVGSKDYGSTATFRNFYSASEYVGVDMEHGKGVDLVVDLVEGTGALPLDHFDLVICCSVMEHVRKPWVFADNLTKLTREGGQIYISVPWVWRYHAYPDDYFRFSYRGIMELFPEFEWASLEYSTNVPDEFIPISGESKKTDDSMAHYRPVAFLSKQRRKYLPYLMVNMVGTKRAKA